MTENEAKQLVASVPATYFKEYKKRAISLLVKPDKLNQGAFGVCGMASCVYFLLVYNPAQFVELLKAIFGTEDFSGVAIPRSKTGSCSQLLTSLRFQHSSKVLSKNLQSGDGTFKKFKFELDFLLSRALGEILKIKNKALYDEQVAFSEPFAENFSSKKKSGDTALLKGDLALNEDGLKYVIKEVCGAHSVDSSTNFETAKKAMNILFKTKVAKQPFAFGLVRNWSNCYGESPVQDKAPVPGPDKPVYAHIIVVHGPINAANEVPTWTWAMKKTITFASAAVMKSYFYGFVYGQLKA